MYKSKQFFTLAITLLTVRAAKLSLFELVYGSHLEPDWSIIMIIKHQWILKVWCVSKMLNAITLKRVYTILLLLLLLLLFNI